MSVELLNINTITDPEEMALVHVAVDRFYVQDGFSIALKVVHIVPDGRVFALNNQLNVNVVIIFFLFKKGHCL